MATNRRLLAATLVHSEGLYVSWRSSLGLLDADERLSALQHPLYLSAGAGTAVRTLRSHGIDATIPVRIAAICLRRPCFGDDVRPPCQRVQQCSRALSTPRAPPDDQAVPMLIVTLGPGDSVMIGDDIEVSLEQVRTEKVIVGVEAPKAVPVYSIDGVERLNEPAPRPERLRQAARGRGGADAGRSAGERSGDDSLPRCDGQNGPMGFAPAEHPRQSETLTATSRPTPPTRSCARPCGPNGWPFPRRAAGRPRAHR